MLGSTEDAFEVWWFSKNIVFFAAGAIILAPLLETLFFQYLPLKICQSWLRKYRYSFCTTIVIASIVFAAMHKSEISYFVAVFLAGLAWGFSCFVLMRKKRHPILYTTLMHACYNGVLIISVLTLYRFDLL